jgi:hypothetical protein
MADGKLIDNGDQLDFTVATDEIGGRDYQYVKLVYGPDGTATIVDTTTQLPVAVYQGGTITVQPGNTANTTAWKTDGSAVTQPVSGSVSVSTVPAAARTTDSVSASLSVDKLMNNLTAVSPVRIIIDHAVSGDNTLVAAAGASNIILVHQLFLVAAAAVTVRFESGTGGTALTGQMNIAANQGFVLPFSPIGWFQTAANTLLNLELSSATSVDGCLVYTVIT